MGPNIIKVDQNSNPTGGENDPGLGKSIDDLLKVEQDTFSHLSASYDPNLKPYGVIDGGGSQGIYAEATDSIFNPFYLFRYAKYGNIAGPKGYDVQYHRDINPISQNNETQKNTVTKIAESKKKANNPTATQIIEWANVESVQEKGVMSPLPYQWNDFLWCKYYGRIPNNRLLTLRRYPIPIEDNVRVAESRMPLVPIAQAVTWWGEETGNSLNNVLGMNYGFGWESRTASVTDVFGNEIDAAAALDALALGKTTADGANFRNFIATVLFSAENNPYATSGLDKKLQTWVQESYTKGAYWNRVLGPVNVINSTQIRKTGFEFKHNITLKFSYKLRSFNNINPKIAMLDLITNFLALTYNKAEWWGGSSRYFPKTGLTINGLPQNEFENGDYIKGIGEFLKFLLQRGQGTAGELMKLIGRVVSGDATVDETLAKIENSPAARNVAGSWVKNLIQGPLSIRALLDGRAVGEWHLTVGNPMDPIAVIGNLCLKTTKISFSDSVGLDDFPTEVNFELTLEPGRARAKQDIESMFNLGGGDMSFTPLPEPSSAYNTLGERNSELEKQFRAQNNSTANAKDAVTTDNRSIVSNSSKEANNFANFFRTSVRKAYGPAYADSSSLELYFKDLKTKD